MRKTSAKIKRMIWGHVHMKALTFKGRWVPHFFRQVPDRNEMEMCQQPKAAFIYFTVQTTDLTLHSPFMMKSVYQRNGRIISNQQDENTAEHLKSLTGTPSSELLDPPSSSPTGPQ